MAKLNALVREYLVEFAAAGDLAEERAALLELMDLSKAGSTEKGRTWTREDIYEEHTSCRHS